MVAVAVGAGVQGGGNINADSSIQGRVALKCDWNRQDWAPRLGDQRDDMRKKRNKRPA